MEGKPVKRNSKEFKAIAEIIEKYAEKPQRKRLIKLYIVKAGHKLDSKIPIDKLGKEGYIYYDLNYDAVKRHLKDPDLRLYKADAEEPFYYFLHSRNKTWDQNPFELKGKLAKEILKAVHHN